MRKNKIFFFIMSITFIACSPKVKNQLTDQKFPVLGSEELIFVLEQTDELPIGSSFVADLKIGDTGFSNDCDYEVVMKLAKQEAQKSGANIIHIVNSKQPDFFSSCYRLKAKMYRNTDPLMTAAITEKNTVKNQSRLPENADYAVVYFYRPEAFVGSAIGYKIRHGDETKIGRVRNGEKFEYKTTDFGSHTFWGKTDTRDSVVIDIQKGQEYYVRCGIKTGIFVGRPTLTIKENHLGVKEYNELK